MNRDRRWNDVHATGPYGPAGSILDNDQKLVWVNEDDSLRDALTLLCAHRYLQTPALGGDRCVGVLGLINVLGRLLEEEPFKSALGARKVGDYLDLKPRYLDASAAIDEDIDWHHDGYSLIGNPKKVRGILTAADLLKRLRTHVEAFVLLEAIERDLRSLFDKLLPLPASRDLVLSAIDAKGFERPRKFGTYADLTYGHYEAICHNDATFEHLDPACTWERKRLVNAIREVGGIRNRVVHFNGGATPKDREFLLEMAALTAQACDRAGAAATTAPAV